MTVAGRSPLTCSTPALMPSKSNVSWATLRCSPRVATTAGPSSLAWPPWSGCTSRTPLGKNPQDNGCFARQRVVPPTSAHSGSREGRNHGKGQAVSLRHLWPIRSPQYGQAEPEDDNRRGVRARLGRGRRRGNKGGAGHSRPRWEARVRLALV